LPRCSIYSGLIALGLTSLTVFAQADTISSDSVRYEIGIGGAYSKLADYPGSAISQHYLLPFPYIRYQSDKLKLDRNEALGQLFQAGNWSLNVSLAAALPVNSDDNAWRQGMPDLLWITEVGPTLDYVLFKADTDKLTFRIPLRKAIATDLQHWQSTGWRFEPHFRWQQQVASQLQFTSQLAALWSTAQYHQYLYGVAAQYATADRPAYQAAGGFSGWRLSGGLSWRSRNWWLGGFVRYDNLQQAQFNDSPLVQRQHSVSYGVAFAWIFKQQGQFDE
jgi:MipA family protein